jgi:hypothetical protein
LIKGEDFSVADEGLRVVNDDRRRKDYNESDTGGIS